MNDTSKSDLHIIDNIIIIFLLSVLSMINQFQLEPTMRIRFLH